MDDLRATEVAAAVRAGKLDPVELTERCLRALEERADLNAVITLCADEALAAARERRDGPLAGVPLLVKDLFDTAGIRTTYGSAIHRDRVPDRTAPPVQRLLDAGAIMLGKANLHEFAWGTSSHNVHFGHVQNPRRPGKIAGGSSGGNSAALAAGLCALTLGSDTGGSIRMPSACCGTVGFKPLLGSITTEGAYPLVASLDTVGPMATTVADCAVAHQVLTGEPVPAPRLDGLTVGLLNRVPEVGAPGPEPTRLDGRAARWADRLEALGARCVEVELEAPRGNTWPLFYFEAAEAHRATFPSRRDEYGPDLQVKLDDAQRATREAAEETRRVVAEWRERAGRALEVDLLVSPTLGVEELPDLEEWEPDYRIAMTEFTRPFNWLGWPALAIGDLQLAGLRNDVVLAAGLAWEEAYGSSAEAVPPTA